MHVKSLIKVESKKKGKKEKLAIKRKRGDRGRKKQREMSGGGGIERCVSPVLDCFSLIALH